MALAVSIDQTNNPVSFDEDRSEYFRHEINFNMSNQQIIAYLTQKEYSEKKKNEDLGALYILNLVEPFDRKFDSAIGETWQKLTTAEKNNYRLEWFMRNRRTISPRDICNYINIENILLKARESEQQFRQRAKRVKISFDNVMPDSQFLTAVEKSFSTADVKFVKQYTKNDIDEPAETKKKISASPAVSSKKTAKIRKSKKTMTAARGKNQKKEQVKKQSVKQTKNESELSGLKPRNLNVDELKIEIQKEKSSTPDLNSVNTQIENLQTKITNLRKQLNNTASEIDSLRNYKKKSDE